MNSFLKCSVRKTEKDDIPKILKLAVGAQEFSAGGRSFWTKDQLLQWAWSQKDVCLVATVGNKGSKIVGFVLVAVHIPTSKATWENQFVHPDYRNKGVALKLYTEMIRVLHSRYVRFLVGHMKKGNKSNSFYTEVLGFENLGEFYFITKDLHSGLEL